MQEAKVSFKTCKRIVIKIPPSAVETEVIIDPRTVDGRLAGLLQLPPTATVEHRRKVLTIAADSE